MVPSRGEAQRSPGGCTPPLSRSMTPALTSTLLPCLRSAPSPCSRWRTPPDPAARSPPRAPARSRLAPRRVERMAMMGGGDHRASHPRAARGRPSSLRRRKLPRTSCTSLRPTSGLSLRPRSWLPPWMRPAALLIRPTSHGAGSPLPGRTRPPLPSPQQAAAAPGGGGVGTGPARACFPSCRCWPRGRGQSHPFARVRCCR